MRADRGRTATLVFDGDCGFCTRCVAWMRRWLSARPRILAWQETDLAALGVTQAQAEKAVQWIEADGRVETGARAIARVLQASGGLWPLLGTLLLVPPVSWLAAVAYDLIANNRSRLPGGTPACSLPQADRDRLLDPGPG